MWLFDGTGYGDDGNLWGGEFMVCDYEGYERVAHINYFKLLGGDKAIKEPRRVALSLLFDLYQERALTLDNPTTQAFNEVELKSYFLAWKKGLNAPLSSSVGRLFDAVASLLGICQVMSFEGESGMHLEEYYSSDVVGHYSFRYDQWADRCFTYSKRDVTRGRYCCSCVKVFPYFGRDDSRGVCTL